MNIHIHTHKYVHIHQHMDKATGNNIALMMRSTLDIWPMSNKEQEFPEHFQMLESILTYERILDGQEPYQLQI